MKTALIIVFVISASGFAVGQELMKNDPTYSIHNYKQPNKAAYALEHGHKNANTLEQENATVSENYKQQNAAKKVTKVAAISARQNVRKTESYKHPRGL